MQQLSLPSSVATKAQLLSLRKNVDDVLEAITQNQIRLEENVEPKDVPQVSGTLASLLSINKLKPTTEIIQEIKKWVEFLLHHAPIVRITLASEPGPKELNRLVDWFRQESGKIVLLHVGIQPTIAAGAVVRTTSHRYDMSLRNELLHRTDSFIEAVVKVSERAAANAPAPTAQTPEAA